MIAGNLLWSIVADWWFQQVQHNSLSKSLPVKNSISKWMIVNRYGRRKAYLGLLLVLSTGTFMSAISPNIYFYGVARFIAGSGYSGNGHIIIDYRSLMMTIFELHPISTIFYCLQVLLTYHVWQSWNLWHQDGDRWQIWLVPWERASFY